MIEQKKVVILSTVTYTDKFYQMTDDEKDDFHQQIAQLMGKYGVNLVARYKIISKPDQVLNIFETASLDTLVNLRNEIDRMNYGLYIRADWQIALPA